MVCFGRDIVRGSSFGGLFLKGSGQRISVWRTVLEGILSEDLFLKIYCKLI